MTSTFIYEMQSEIAKGKRNWKAVIEHNQKVISIDRKNSFAYYEIALAYEQIGDPINSLKYATISFEINSSNFFTIQLLTRLYSKLKNDKKTYEYAKLSIENMPEEVPPPSMKLIKTLRLFRAIPIIKRIYQKLSKERSNWGDWRNEWVDWAYKYISWYENTKLKPN